MKKDRWRHSHCGMIVDEISYLENDGPTLPKSTIMREVRLCCFRQCRFSFLTPCGGLSYYEAMVLPEITERLSRSFKLIG